MGSLNKVFGSILGRNVFVNSAVALYKYVYCRLSHLYSFTADMTSRLSLLVSLGF